MTAALPRSLQDNAALGQWISLDTPGFVTVRTGKVELGQGILTALAQIAAEELGLGMERVVIGAADTALSPNEGFTAGSQSVEVSGAAIRLAAAQARTALLDAGADRLAATVTELSCRDGTILWRGEPSGFDFWTVASGVDWRQSVRGDGQSVPAERRRHIGTSVPRIDLSTKLGAGGFIHDLNLPGMRHVRIVRQPFRLARLKAVDEDGLRRRHPAVAVLRRADFLALVADDEWSAHHAQEEADAFVTWEEVPDRWRPASAPEPAVLSVGSPEVSTRGSNGFAADYARGMIAHASIGPSCAIAVEEGSALTIWTHSQGIFSLRDQVAACLGRNPDDVRVIHAHGAGCYGHNGADDAAFDAAVVATMLPGRPVRVQWSRTDELARGPLGPGMSARVEAMLDDRNRVAAWSMSVKSRPHAQRPGAGGHANLSSAEALDPSRLPNKVQDLAPAAGGGASRNSVPIYDFPSHEVRVEIDTASPVRTSSLRSLGAHLNVFAIKCAMDELAAQAEADPLAFRMDHLADERARKVLRMAAEMGGWSLAASREGHGMGLAVARYKGKGAYLAAAADVEIGNEVRLRRLWLAVDAGALINPEGARSQIEGGALQSASWTLKEEVPLEDGRVPAFGWDSYAVLRFSELPQVKTRFVIDPDSPPLGTGEAAQGPVAAAIGNAISRALGMRVRRLPLTRERLLGTMLET